MFRQELERDGLAELEIVGAIDFTHAAFAQQANDAIALRQHRARHETRIIDLNRTTCMTGTLFGVAYWPAFRRVPAAASRPRTSAHTTDTKRRRLRSPCDRMGSSLAADCMAKQARETD